MRLGTLSGVLIVVAGTGWAQDTNFAVGPQYLMTSGSPLLARPIATPSLSLGEAPPAGPAAETNAGAGVQFAMPAEAAAPANLLDVYYGPQPSIDASVVVEISSAEPAQPVPASIINVGVSGFTDAPSLRSRGYGVGVGEAAQVWKSRKAQAPRIYTNRDIERLRGN